MRPGSNKPLAITQQEEDHIRSLLVEFLAHTKKPEVGIHSNIGPYLDCAAYEKLRQYGKKALPYFIEQASRQQDSYTYLGSYVISGKVNSNFEETYAYKKKRMDEVSDETLPPFLLTYVMREIAPGEEPEIDRESELGGIATTDCFIWLKWWAGNRSQYLFETVKPIEIHEYEEIFHGEHISAKVDNDLLDLYSVFSTYRHVIERVAAAFNRNVIIGDHLNLDKKRRIRMKQVTFDEFLYIIGELISAEGYYKQVDGEWKFVSSEGFHFKVEEDQYIIGDNTPPFEYGIYGSYLREWRILMDKTVYSKEDRVSVKLIANSSRWESENSMGVLLSEGIFILRNPIDHSYHEFGVQPSTHIIEVKKEPVIDENCPPKEKVTFDLMIDPAQELPVGEFNLIFKCLDDETACIPIEIY